VAKASVNNFPSSGCCDGGAGAMVPTVKDVKDQLACHHTYTKCQNENQNKIIVKINQMMVMMIQTS